jgi:formylmethanofuran dehydrogenase subunit D
MSECFILITGRTTKQGRDMHEKNSEAYRLATELVEMSQADMARLNIETGQRVTLRAPAGDVEVVAQAGKDMPEGMVFVPMGPAANVLISQETESTGCPHYKGPIVEVLT